MTSKLRGNYNNKLEDYKTELSKTQKHCLKFIHAFHQNPSRQPLTKTELSHQKGISSTKIHEETNKLIQKGLVKVMNENKLKLTEKGVQKL